jgi:transposase InsO family protein
LVWRHHLPPHAEDRLFPATVIDIASRKVVGWVAAGHLRASRVTRALTAVWKTRT